MMKGGIDDDGNADDDDGEDAGDAMKTGGLEYFVFLYLFLSQQRWQVHERGDATAGNKDADEILFEEEDDGGGPVQLRLNGAKAIHEEARLQEDVEAGDDEAKDDPAVVGGIEQGQEGTEFVAVLAEEIDAQQDEEDGE